MKHTPGPWRIGKTADLEIVVRAEEVDGQPYLCRVLHSVDEWEANAVLIAAAPEMHETLMVAFAQMVTKSVTDAMVKKVATVLAKISPTI